MSHFRHLFAVFTALAAFTGCGQAMTGELRHPPSGPGSGAQVSGPAAPAPSAGGAAAGVLRFAQGTWLTDCRVLPFRTPFRTKLTFSGMSLTHESSVYQDAQCRQRLSTWSRVLTVTQVRREELVDEPGVELELSVRAGAVSFTTYNGYGAAASGACGLSNWIDGATRNVSGRQCGPGRLERTGRELTLRLKHDPDFGKLDYQGDVLRLQ